ncbi:hypothetical protein RD792_007916 [Penstemon davidsonii]|uniref:RNA helicase SDE3 n=1 Tax=Penstemon davidsonii TaxID=160366 RepID=A0ABR0D7P6_9LAMI|nr:hypothetical protein RD792_007916 [Penstemon davidsonii]
MFDSICIKNITDEPLDLWSVSIYDSKPENSFTISLMEPPSVNSDEQYIQDFIELFSLEVLRTDQDFSIWLSCKPKEIGLHSTAVHFSVGNKTIERLVFLLAEDKVSQSLSSSKPFYRARKKKSNVLDQTFVAGRRPSKGSIRGSMHWLRLAEKRPSLVNGDHIFVKLASEDETAKVYEGYIHRVEAEEIFLYFDSKFHKSHRESNLYNVQFTYNRTCMLQLYQAVEAAKCLDDSFLFPSLSKMRLVKPGPLVPISCNPNEEQTRAIKMILACKGGCLYVIHGPPGTGKTMTLIESILQIYHSWKKARILVCSTSKNAADHLLDRLISEGSAVIEPRDIFRLNASTRPFEDVNPDNIDFCRVEDFIFTCHSHGDLEKFRIVISTYRSASLLYEQGIKRGHFSHIFLDEAGHASVPETMVPLSHLYSNNIVVVLVGDPLQLGPVVFCKDAEINGLGTSYLERLCELYANGNKNVMTKLIRNYRTHPAILYLPSHLFYNGVLIP